MDRANLFLKLKGDPAEGNGSVTEVLGAVYFTVLLLFWIVFAFICTVFFQQRRMTMAVLFSMDHVDMSQWNYQASMSSFLWSILQRPEYHRRFESDMPQETDHRFQRGCCENQSIVIHVKLENHKEKEERLFWCARYTNCITTAIHEKISQSTNQPKPTTKPNQTTQNQEKTNKQKKHKPNQN